MFGLGDLDDFIAVIECLNEVLHHAFELGKQRPTAEIAYSHENDGAEIRPVYRERGEVLVLCHDHSLFEVTSFPYFDVCGMFHAEVLNVSGCVFLSAKNFA
jgi:hypothetical protein